MKRQIIHAGPLSILQFSACLKLIKSEHRLFDRYTATYDHWRAGPVLCHGMKNRWLDCPHGIVRKYDSTRCAVYEASYFEGQLHGLYRGFFLDRVCYGIFDKGKRVTQVTVGQKGQAIDCQTKAQNKFDALLLNIISESSLQKQSISDAKLSELNTQ